MNSFTNTHSLNQSLNELFRRSQLRNHRNQKVLKQLIPDALSISGNHRMLPSDLCCDSRRVSPGAVFFAVSGTNLDGNKFIPDAIARGAAAIVTDKQPTHQYPATTVLVKDVRTSMAHAARRFWGMPEKKLDCVGITGTKGKTTTAYLLNYLLKNAGEDTGVLSTIEYNVGERALPSPRTTPDSIDTYAYLCEMVKNGCSHAVMEASSHALTQGRLIGLPFQVALFTNLSSEHMDYHTDMEDYYQAKRTLFTGELSQRPKTAVINLDDPFGQRLFGEIHERVEIITFGTLPACDIQLEDFSCCHEGSEFTVRLARRHYKGWLPITGKHNLMNAMGALAAAYALGLNIKQAVASLENFEGVPGRLERIAHDQPFEVIVDYAHTDEALRCTLEALRPLYKGRLITVFGCGGNRDQSKRSRMTTVAMQHSNVTIATADNPRGESLAQIFDHMKEGVIPGQPIDFIADRSDAIAHAFEIAQPGDCVLIAGKGHETYQELSDCVLPFDDRSVAREHLSQISATPKPKIRRQSHAEV